MSTTNFVWSDKFDVINQRKKTIWNTNLFNSVALVRFALVNWKEKMLIETMNHDERYLEYLSKKDRYSICVFFYQHWCECDRMWMVFWSLCVRRRRSYKIKTKAMEFAKHSAPLIEYFFRNRKTLETRSRVDGPIVCLELHC